MANHQLWPSGSATPYFALSVLLIPWLKQNISAGERA